MGLGSYIKWWIESLLISPPPLPPVSLVRKLESRIHTALRTILQHALGEVQDDTCNWVLAAAAAAAAG